MGREEGREMGREEGLAEGQARALVKMLELKKESVLTVEARQRILECTDVDLIEQWFERAVTASSLDEIFSAG